MELRCKPSALCRTPPSPRGKFLSPSSPPLLAPGVVTAPPFPRAERITHAKKYSEKDYTHPLTSGAIWGGGLGKFGRGFCAGWGGGEDDPYLSFFRAVGTPKRNTLLTEASVPHYMCTSIGCRLMWGGEVLLLIREGAHVTVSPKSTFFNFLSSPSVWLLLSFARQSEPKGVENKEEEEGRSPQK